jgi:hypothetical protein
MKTKIVGDQKQQSVARLVTRLAEQLDAQLPQGYRFGIVVWNGDALASAVSDGVEVEELVKALRELGRQHGLGSSLILPGGTLD